jgi:hypothetical protein
VSQALPEAFYRREGDTYFSTALTRGPWSNDHQHGGPPSALMARAAERWGDGAQGWLVARLLVDYLKPIPIVPLEVAVEPVKLGRSAQRLTVHLSQKGEELARAQVLRIRRAGGSAVSGRPAALPPPHGLPPFTFPFFRHEVGYHRGIEGRYLYGAFGDSQVTVWARLTAPLVHGEQPSGLQRVVAIVDAESGVCNPLDVRRYTFVNPDLVVMLDREHQGEWVGLEALSTASPLGVGLAQSAVHDLHGPVGRSAQTLVIERLGS